MHYVLCYNVDNILVLPVVFDDNRTSMELHNTLVSQQVIGTVTGKGRLHSSKLVKTFLEGRGKSHF